MDPYKNTDRDRQNSWIGLQKKNIQHTETQKEKSTM